MILTFLGTGTSTGVPMIGCSCKVCRSEDAHDKRLRCSALLHFDADETPDHQPAQILIDCGPDFRQQALKYHITHLDGILITHEHYDHLGGLDDVRSLPQTLDVYAQQRVIDSVHRIMPYCFGENRYPGSPHIELHRLMPYQQFSIRDIEITPLLIIHHAEILGYRIGPLGYITDCKSMPEQTMQALKGVKTLVINALRIEQHPTHINLSEAIDIARQIGAEQTYFIHFSHNIGLQAEVEPTLPPTMHMAYDGLTIEIR